MAHIRCGRRDHGGCAAHCDVVHHGGVPAVPVPAASRSASERRARQNVVNLLLAIAAVLAVVAVVLLMFPQQKPVQRPVDVGASAAAAARVAPFPIVVPRPGADWTVNVARWSDGASDARTPTGADGAPANWYLAFVAPDRQLLRFYQADAARIGRLAPRDLTRTGGVSVSGLSWTVYQDPSRPDDGTSAWIAQDGTVGYLVLGRAPDGDFRRLATAVAQGAGDPVRP